MKLEDSAKSRVRLKSTGHRWLLLVDNKSVISTTDRHWLRRFAVKLRRTLSGDGGHVN